MQGICAQSKAGGIVADTNEKLIINKENLVWGGMPVLRLKTDLIVLHHSAASGDVKNVHRYHRGLGWKGIAYHYYVRRSGSIWQGREENEIGGHSGMPTDRVSIGVCAEGNFEREQMSDAQKKALKLLIADIKSRYPGALIIRHSDVKNTVCPGRNYPFDEICSGSKNISNESPTEKVHPAAEKKEQDNKMLKAETEIFQRWLNRPYIKESIAVDSIFGPETLRAAVKTVQHWLNLSCGANILEDGIFGAKTRAAIKIPLKKGSLGIGVFCVQGLLLRFSISAGKLDGIYGEKTEKAVSLFQKRCGIEEDGIAGRETFSMFCK